MRQNRIRNAFTLVDFLIVIAVLAAVFVVYLPTTTHYQPKAPKIVCTNNLKLVGSAFRMWALDHNDQMPMSVSLTNGGAMEAAITGNVATIFQVISNELVTPKVLFCPTDRKRMQATTFDQGVAGKGVPVGISFLNNSNATYFVGLDATDLLPNGFLSGDDNLLVAGAAAGAGILSLATNAPVEWSEARHVQLGNIGLADASVQSFSSRALQRALANTRLATNRLAMP
jgi:competence protein ComGC